MRGLPAVAGIAGRIPTPLDVQEVESYQNQSECVSEIKKSVLNNTAEFHPLPQKKAKTLTCLIGPLVLAL